MEVLSREYGWTPSEIRDMTRQEISDYMAIIATRNQLEALANKKSKHG